MIQKESTISENKIISETKEDANEKFMVSVVIPVLNEERYIAKCIESVLEQDYPKDDNFELIIVDGDSGDKTVEIIKQYITKYPFIKLLSNPEKAVPNGVNIGMRAAKGKYVVRLDAHAEYAKDYISQCVYYITNTDAVNVGGPAVAKGKNDVQKVVAAAYHSRFALGGGASHEEELEGYVDTVSFGTFDKAFIEKLNFFDVTLPRAEDDDLNYRIIRAGGKVYMTPKIKSVYYPRDRYLPLFKQYYGFGYWRVASIKKHGEVARIPHLIPPAFVVFLVLGAILSIFSNIVRIAYAVILALYLLLDIYFSFKTKKISGIKNRLRLIWVHFILHIAYGSGFLIGLFNYGRFKFAPETM